MHVNPLVVRALLALKGVSLSTVSLLTHISLPELSAWLDASEPSEGLTLERQLEVLRLLGVGETGPRSDVVHYWRISESFWDKPAQSYWPISVALKAFDGAETAFISRDSDPAWNFSNVVHFGLKFPEFLAILEITAHPLKSVSFSPETVEGLTWVPDTLGVLLSPADFAALGPGGMSVKQLQKYLAFTAEMSQWDRLREAAVEQGIRAEQVATLLLGTNGPGILLGTPDASNELPRKAPTRTADMKLFRSDSGA